MKKLFLSVIVSLFVCSAFASTNNEDPTVAVSKTAKELTQLLNDSFNGNVLENEELIKVIFTVNELHELVVLQVNSDDSNIQYYVKNALNYKKVSSDELIVGKEYAFKIKFQN